MQPWLVRRHPCCSTHVLCMAEGRPAHMCCPCLRSALLTSGTRMRVDALPEATMVFQHSCLRQGAHTFRCGGSKGAQHTALRCLACCGSGSLSAMAVQLCSAGLTHRELEQQMNPVRPGLVY